MTVKKNQDSVNKHRRSNSIMHSDEKFQPVKETASDYNNGVDGTSA